MRWKLTFAILGSVLSAISPGILAQLADPTAEAVRVTVSLNADGSRTVYEFDTLHHQATATTTGKNGKRIGRIHYGLDAAGRFTTGDVYGPEDRLRFKTLYKYDTSGKLSQEIQLGIDDSIQHKILYAYGPDGKQIGYEVRDAAGKLISHSGAVAPPASPPPKRAR